MVMETVQIRLTKKLVEKINGLVKEGFYPNKSEAVRDAVRRLIVMQEIGELGEELEDWEEQGGEIIRKGKGEAGKGRELAEHIRELRKYCY